jgi:hypothetical protein
MPSGPGSLAGHRGALPAARQSAKILAALPKAAELDRRQIAQGLDNDPRAALKARVILWKLFAGNVRFMPDADGGLWAERWNPRPY